MGKLDQFMQGRNEGMDFALRIVKQGGIEALEEEIRKRGIYNCSLNVTNKELEKAAEQIKRRVFDTVMTFTVGVLHDRYGFGKVRIQRFMDDFAEGAQLLQDGAITWESITESIDEAMGIKINLHENNTNAKITKQI